MKHRFSKKAVSLLLVVVLAIGIMPMAVFAAENEIAMIIQSAGLSLLPQGKRGKSGQHRALGVAVRVAMQQPLHQAIYDGGNR